MPDRRHPAFDASGATSGARHDTTSVGLREPARVMGMLSSVAVASTPRHITDHSTWRQGRSRRVGRNTHGTAIPLRRSRPQVPDYTHPFRVARYTRCQAGCETG
jgi:hypothetical protein